MPMIGIGVERHINDDAYVRDGGFYGANSFWNKTFLIKGFTSFSVFEFWINMREEGYGRNTKIMGMMASCKAKEL